MLFRSNDTATTEIYTLSLHDALPIFATVCGAATKTLRIESAVDAERFIEDVGFANTLTDARRAGPSLYIAVCGRRDVSLPRNVQKDERRGQGFDSAISNLILPIDVA